MKLKFFEKKDVTGSAKLTVQKSGKLGFSKAAESMINLREYRYCRFAINEEDKGDNSIYLLTEKEKESNSYQISKAGEYYYIQAKQLLSDIGIDYKDTSVTVIFDVFTVRDERNLYRLSKRVIQKRNAKGS